MFRTNYDKSNKIWSGVKTPDLFHSNLSLGQAILWKLERNPNKISQINDDSGIRLTNKELHIKTVRAAKNLEKLGFQKNDVFCLVANNSHHVAPIVFASLCIGCPINFLDPGFSKTEIMYMFGITKPKLVFCDVDVCSLVKICLTELQSDSTLIYTLGGPSKHSNAVEDLFAETQNDTEFICSEIDAKGHTAMIICSSGTTGLPKAVCVSHAVLLNQLIFTFDFTENDVIMSFSSLHWLAGVIQLIQGTLFGATRVNTTDKFTPQLLLKIIEKYKVTRCLGALHYLTITTKCGEAANYDLSSLRNFYAGGSRAPLEICNEMKGYLPNGEVHAAYGLSELGTMAAVNMPFSGRDCVGKLSCNIDVKIVDANGERCGIGEDGEVCIKPKYTFLGYYGNEEATKQSIDNEGFLLTGDIGHFDEDGYLYVTDRKKDILRYCASQISPTEIESFLMQFSGIRAACVVGVSDLKYIQLPAAVIVKSQDSEVTKEEIDRLVRENFADCKRLRGGVYFVDALPVTPSGKIIRRKVTELAEQLYKQQN